MIGPLDGIRVVDLTSLASGPFATAILADQGADVIKVESPAGGDLMRHMSVTRGGLSAIFASMNRNKRSIALDLRDPRGKDVLLRLVETADVFIQNFRPGVIERMGFGEPELRKRRPDLVYVSVSGFGETGPYAQRKVFDSVIQVLAGFAAAQAGADGEPELMRNMICDKLSALTVSQAITAALLGASRGQGGTHVRLNMLDACIAFFWPDGMANHALLNDDGTTVQNEGGRGMTLRRAADGHMTISGIPQNEFEGICRAIGREDLIGDERVVDSAARMRNIEFFESVIDEFTRERTIDEVSERLEAEQVVFGRVNTRETLLDDPQVVANELVVTVEHETAGRFRTTRPVARFGDLKRAIRRPPPSLGEHADEILTELGVSAAEVDALRTDGVLGA